MSRLARIPGRSILCAVLLFTLSACAQRVWMMVPPKFSLGEYERIGLVEFHCADKALQQQATRRFQEMVLEARPGSWLILLPSDALGDRERRPGELDPAAIRALAEQHDLDAVFLGSLEVSEMAPTIGITSSLVELNARAEILGTMSAQLIEPEGGATVWLRSADERATVASGGVNSAGEGSFGMTDPTATRSAMVHTLASQVTHDFRAQYFRKRLEDIPPGYQLTYPDGVEVYVPPSAVEDDED